MREWFALNAIERFREEYPDLTKDEEDQVFDFYMADDGRCLFFRCSFNGAGQPLQHP